MRPWSIAGEIPQVARAARTVATATSISGRALSDTLGAWRGPGFSGGIAPDGRAMRKKSRQVMWKVMTAPTWLMAGRSSLHQLDQRAAEILGMQEEHRLAVATDTIGIRPGALTLAAPDSPATRLTGTIESPGGEFHVHLRLGDCPEALVAGLPIDTRLEEAADLTLHAPHTDLHPFNSRTGRRTDLN